MMESSYLEHLSTDELAALLAQLPQEIASRHEAKRQRVIEELSALARAHGFAMDELLGQVTPAVASPAPMSKRAVRRPAKIKYRHPDQPTLTWTGRGKTPRWVTAWLASGAELAQLQM